MITDDHPVDSCLTLLFFKPLHLLLQGTEIAKALVNELTRLSQTHLQNELLYHAFLNLLLQSRNLRIVLDEGDLNLCVST